MMYRFIDNLGTFLVEQPQKYKLYLPLTNREGSILSSISPNLAGDIKKDNDHFLTPPASIEDIGNNLLCRRDFFLRTDRETLRLSFPYKDTLEAGFLYQKMRKKAGALDIEILNFIPYNLAVEVMWVKVANKSNQAKRITPTSFIPLYGRAEKNLRDHRHVSSLLNRIELDRYGIFLKPTMVFDEKGHLINETIYFVFGYEGKTCAPVGQFPTLEYFCGEGDLISPDAIEKEVKPLQRKIPDFDGKETCAAFRFQERILKAQEERDYILIMGIDNNKRRIKDTFRKLNSTLKIKQTFQETKKYWLNHLRNLEFDFQDKNFNEWLLWVKMQPVFRKLFGCSFLPHFDYGKGGRGWRDIWQDALFFVLLAKPEKARSFILNNFKGIRIDGSNTAIVTKEGEFISDRNRINRVWMDHGIWPYLTCRLYINKTKDLDFLSEEVSYFKDAQFKRAQETDLSFAQNDCLLRNKNNKIYQGSILEHMLIQNLVQFFNVGEHNIIRLENADWNDGLDMAAQRGESVTFSFMYAHNLRDICNFLEKLKEKKGSIKVLKELSLLLDRIYKPVNYLNYKDKQKRLAEYLGKIKKISGEKIKVRLEDLIDDLKQKAGHLSGWLRDKEWLKEGFFNGYYDNRGKRVEGRINGRIRMMLASQVFAIMSGVAEEEQIKKILISLNRYLKDKKLGGFRLNTDFKDVYMDLGRAFGFSYGDKENGAFFNHMVVLLANALYKRGFVKEGFEVISSIYKMATATKSAIYPMIPEYFNRQGRGLYLYLTGSASWYIYTLMEEILGIKFILGDILLEPKLLNSNFFKNEIEVKFNLHGKIVKLIYVRKRKTEKIFKIQQAFLEHKEIPPDHGQYLIKKENLQKRENTIKVYLG